MMDSEKKELQDMEKLAHLLSVRTLFVTFCFLLVLGVIYFFMMKYFFHDSYKECNDVTCAILCDVCDIEPNETEESWISAGTFGDMFGALTCLFTGLGVAGVLVTLKLQYKTFIQQMDEHKYNVAHSEKIYIRDLILHLRNVLTNFSVSYQNRNCECIWNANKLKDETKNILEQFQYYVDGSNTPDGLAGDFAVYLKKLNLILPIVSQSYYILKELSRSPNLNDEDINNLTSFLEFNLTPEIKQLLNLCFLRFELAENLTAYGSLFNDDIVFQQLKRWGGSKVSETAIRYLMNSIKANQACHEAERIEQNGVRTTIIKELLRPIYE